MDAAESESHIDFPLPSLEMKEWNKRSSFSSFSGFNKKFNPNSKIGPTSISMVGSSRME